MSHIPSPLQLPSDPNSFLAHRQSQNSSGLTDSTFLENAVVVGDGSDDYTGTVVYTAGEISSAAKYEDDENFSHDMSHDEHNELISRTSHTRLGDMVQGDVLPHGVNLANNTTNSTVVEMRRCQSTRWGKGLQSNWSTIEDLQRTKSRYQRGSSALTRPTEGWFHDEPKEGDSDKASWGPTEVGPEEEAAEDISVGCGWGVGGGQGCDPYGQCKRGKIWYSTFIILFLATISHMISAVLYCITSERDFTVLDRCYLNYRVATTGDITRMVEL